MTADIDDSGDCITIAIINAYGSPSCLSFGSDAGDPSPIGHPQSRGSLIKPSSNIQRGKCSTLQTTEAGPDHRDAPPPVRIDGRILGLEKLTYVARDSGESSAAMRRTAIGATRRMYTFKKALGMDTTL